MCRVHGDLVTVHNIRNCAYRTVDDYTVGSTRRRSTSASYLGRSDRGAVQRHAVDRPRRLSFGFEDQDFVVRSVEIRNAKGEKYSAMAGFFNQYELMYVLADERDVMWKEQLASSARCTCIARRPRRSRPGSCSSTSCGG